MGRRATGKGRGQDRGGRSKGGVQYWHFPYAMARHPKFRGLSGHAVKVLIELRIRFNGGNNGRLSLSAREACEQLGMGRSTFVGAIRDLVAAGFVERVRQGTFTKGDASEYRITFLAMGTKPATDEWQTLAVSTAAE